MKNMKMAALLVVLCIFSCFVTPFVKAQQNEITLRVNGIDEDIELVHDEVNAITITYEKVDITQGYIDKVELYTVEDIIEEETLENTIISDIEIIDSSEENKEEIQDEIVDNTIEEIPEIVIPNNTGLIFGTPQEIIEETKNI